MRKSNKIVSIGAQIILHTHIVRNVCAKRPYERNISN